jgi:hypothetical protein
MVLGYNSTKATGIVASLVGATSYSTFCNPDSFWTNAHTAANTTDWTKLDAIVSAAKAGGCTSGLYVLYGCPAWLAQPADQAVNGPNNLPGENSYPTDLSQLAWFCTQFAQRNRTTWGGFFRWVQLFNEPETGGTPFTATASFFKYSAAQFVAQMWTAHAAIKTADPTIETLSAGTFNASVMATWLDAQEGVTGLGKYGYQCFDNLALHPYYARPNPTYGWRGDFATLNSGGIAVFKALLAARGRIGLKFYATEWGFCTYDPPVSALILEMPAADRATLMARTVIGALRAGFSGLWPWGVGHPNNYAGQLGFDATGLDSGYNAAAAALAGKFKDSAGYYKDGRESITFNDRTTYVV